MPLMITVPSISCVTESHLDAVCFISPIGTTSSILIPHNVCIRFIYFLFMFVFVLLSVCTHLCCAYRGYKKASDPLELDSQEVVSHSVYPGNWTLVLYKQTKLS